MKVDFITPTVLFTRTKELNTPLSQGGSQEIFNKFNSLHQYISLCIEGFKLCAKALVSVSNKRIKLNHALEIMSREFFSLPWHTLLPQFERNESSERIKDIFHLLDKLQKSTTGLNCFIFTPALSDDEYKQITSKYPEAQLIKTKEVFLARLNLILDDTQKRLEEGNRENVNLLIACPFYVNQSHHFKDLDRGFSSRLSYLSARSRILGISIYFPNQGVSYFVSDRVPDRYKGPSEVN